MRLLAICVAGSTRCRAVWLKMKIFRINHENHKKKSLINHQLWERFQNIENLIYTDSLGYLDFMKLVTNAQIVITDSGGIQEETTFLQIPCITVRENTERPITITLGNNELIKLNAELISSRMIEKLKSNLKGEIPPLWDGHATERILDILSK